MLQLYLHGVQDWLFGWMFLYYFLRFGTRKYILYYNDLRALPARVIIIGVIFVVFVGVDAFCM